MQQMYFKLWMSLLLVFIIGLTLWAINLGKIEYQISIFSIIGVIIVAVTSVVTLSLNHAKIKERELELLTIKEKQKAYQHFYNFYFILLDQILSGKDIEVTDNLKNEMFLFKKGLMNWGSEELIKDFIIYDNLVTDNADNSKIVLSSMNNFLKSIRKELGFKDSEDLNIMSVILQKNARENILNKNETY